MTAAHLNAARTTRRLTEFRGAPAQHHVVKVGIEHSDKAHKTATAHAYAHGAKLVTGTGRHVVAHFDDKGKADTYHKAVKASGHQDAHMHSVRESCPTR